MADIEMQEKSNSDLWVLVRLKESIYAINGVQVQSISVLDEGLVRLPDSNEITMGTFFFRDSFIPVLNLRLIVGMESREAELDKFEHMLEERKQDHIRWVSTLKDSVEANTPFQLTTDPHQCAFGKWYDHYKPNSQIITYHLKKIDEPHKNLHRMAAEITSCSQDECEKIHASLDKAMHEYMPKVVNLLDETKSVFRDSYRDMMVVVSSGDSYCGLLVDEVLSAEPLDEMTDALTKSGTSADTLVTDIGRRKEGAQNVLVLDLNKLFERYI